MKFRCGSHPATAAVVILLGLTLVLSQSAQAQTYKVLYNFTGGQDGAFPSSGLTMDIGGNLYGTARNGGSSNCTDGCGTVYKLTKKNNNWLFAPLYRFQGGEDGAHPEDKVVIGPNSSLYGTTAYGGSSNCSDGCGTVFNLKPTPTRPPTPLTPWVETVLYRFQGGNDGSLPSGHLVFDASRAIYGVTYSGGGSGNDGTVYKLTPSGQDYTESVIYSFTHSSDGYYPVGAVAFDQAGNLYAVARDGGATGYGTVIQLTPSGGGWTETMLYNFLAPDGRYPVSGVILDQSGNLYGSNPQGGSAGGGTIYELTFSDGGWTFTLVYALVGGYQGGPQDKLVMDAAGNLYGTSKKNGAHFYGSVFKLSPSDQGWTYTTLYDFPGGSNGRYPLCDLILDANGNLYGTTSAGGAYDQGVVFEITP
jgi:uncharacterized repeat protein (TIGR03803 family)